MTSLPAEEDTATSRAVENPAVPLGNETEPTAIAVAAPAVAAPEGLSSLSSNHSTGVGVGATAVTTTTITTSSHSHLLVKTKEAWNDRTDREFELRESSLDRSCLDYLLEQIQLLSAGQRLLKLVIYLDDIGRQHQQPNPQANSRPVDDGFTDEWIASFVEANQDCLRFLRISAQNEILGHEHRRNPSSFMRILLHMQALERLYLSHFDLCPVHAALILWDYFACCLPQAAALDEHGTPRTPPTINDSHYLRDLTLDQCLFDLTSMQMLSSGLRAYGKLQTLEMLHCGLTDVLVAPLLDALQQSKSRLISLDLTDNNITAASLSLLAKLLQHQDCLQTLNLNENAGLFPSLADPPEDVRPAGQQQQQQQQGRGGGAGNQNNNNANENGDNNEAEPDYRAGLQAFCHVLSNHTNLKQLGLIACSVTAITLNSLLQVLGSQTSKLQTLHLQQNAGLRLGDWCRSLRHLQQLRVLNLEEAPLVPTRLAETHASICQFLRELDLNLSLTDLLVSEFAGNANRNVFMRPAIRPIVVRNHYLWRVQELLIAHQDNRIRQDKALQNLPVGACAPLLHKLWSIQGGQTPVFSFLRSDLGANMVQERISASAWKKKRKPNDS